MRSRAHQEVRAADAAARNADEQIPRVQALRRAAPQLPVGPAEIRCPRQFQALVRGLPHRVGDDLQLRRPDSDPVRALAVAALLEAPRIALARAVPDDEAAVEIAIQRFADSGRTPARRAALLRPRRRQSPIVQDSGDRTHAVSSSAQPEDFPDDVRFRVDDPSFDV